MKRKEFEQEVLVRNMSELIDQLVFAGAKNYIECDDGDPLCLNSEGKRIVDGRMELVSFIADELDSLNLFDDSEPRPAKQVYDGDYPTWKCVMDVEELKVKTKNALYFGGVQTINQLVYDVSKTDLLKLRNFGKTALANVNEFLEKYGFETKK